MEREKGREIREEMVDSLFVTHDWIEKGKIFETTSEKEKGKALAVTLPPSYCRQIKY